MTTTHPGLSLPDISTLEIRRRERTREFWMMWFLFGCTLVGTVVTSTSAGLVAVLMFGGGQWGVILSAGLAGVLPYLLLSGVFLYKTRDARALASEVNALRGAPGVGVWRWVGVALLIVVMLGAVTWLPEGGFPALMAGLVPFAIGVAMVRMRVLAWWAWASSVVHALALVATIRWVFTTSDPGVTVIAAMFVAGLHPFVWALFVYGPIQASVDRDDGIGRVCRAWAVLIPPNLRTRDLRGDAPVSDPQPVSGLMGRTILGRVLLMIDHQTTDHSLRLSLCSAAAWACPQSPEPFDRLADLLKEEDPERSAAYAAFSKDNAARTVWSFRRQFNDPD